MCNTAMTYLFNTNLLALETLSSKKRILVLKLAGLDFWGTILIFAFEGLGSTKRSSALEDRFGFLGNHSHLCVQNFGFDEEDFSF
ncbi:hypothetical protein ACOSQ3_005065 [Xanthoceras sorbifolium]